MTKTLARWLAAVMLVPAVARAQSTPAAGERLTLETAIKLAVDNNLALATARLDVEKAEAEIAIARTRRLPSFELSSTASQLLTPVTFSFPAGAFGAFAGIGPVPAIDTEVKTPTQPIAYVSSQVSQPLSQLFRAGLGIQSATNVRDIERERLRERRLSVVNSVKRHYFAILEAQSTLTSLDESIALYRELQRTTEQRVVQKVVLRGDVLDVQYRLAESELARITTANTVASLKEQLNQLLGRDVRTPFDVEAVNAISPLEVELQAAQERALASRPEIAQARLKLQQAELDRRVKKAERIPEVSLAVAYSSNFNLDVMPANLAIAGVQFKWEPFDWGRRSRELGAKSLTIEQARHAVRDAEDRVLLEVNSVFRRLSESRARLAVADAARQAVRERLRVATNQYQVKAALLTDVLQVKAELADRDTRYQQAVLAFYTAKADFDHATGEERIR